MTSSDVKLCSGCDRLVAPEGYHFRNKLTGERQSRCKVCACAAATARSRKQGRKPLSQPRRDCTGIRYGKLLVIERVAAADVGPTAQGFHWRCQCDCGNVVVKPTHHLFQGRVKSCGCSHQRTGADHCMWTGTGELSGNHWSSIQGKARERGIEVTITKEDAWNLFIQQGRSCALSGLPIAFAKTGKLKRTASLDRIDSSRGYELGNVQWLHKDVNWMKNQFDQSYFINICCAIAAHRKTP